MKAYKKEIEPNKESRDKGIIFNSAVKILDRTVERFKNNIALEDNENSYSYIEYQNLAHSLGSCIINKNISGFVGVYLPKSVKPIISFAGILYGGCAYVPMDINMPSARLLKIINHLSPGAIITNSELAKKLSSEFNVPDDKILIYDDIINTEINHQKVQDTVNNIIDTDPVYIMYTSGSTGMPKGVVIPHKGVVDYASWVVETFELDENVVFGNQAPFHFDNSVLDIYGAMLCGGKLNVIPEVFFNFPVKLPEYINEKDINLIFWVPTVIINVANSGILDNIKMDKLKKVLFCGEVMPNKQLNIWRETHPDILYANLYGPTEITDVCTYYIIDRKFGDSDPLPIGKACYNTKTLILNDNNKKADIEEIGELCILGTGLALGYFKEQEISDKVFMQNPLNNGYREIMYRTGDLVYENSEGIIIYVGRKDTQIKHKGNRIELGEIEVIAKGIEEVENACILYDQENSEIVMFAEIAGDIKEREILKRMRSMLTSYMVPSKIIRMDKIPLNPNGKLDRVYLKTLLGARK